MSRLGWLVVAALACPIARAGDEPENLRLAAPGVYTGGVPSGEQWGALAALGVKTVVGVDGFPPDAAATHAHGLQPVHVPIGYGGVEPDAVSALTRVARDARRPVYIYCHHGRHRGPAAAAIVCLAAGLFDREAAAELLESAGTNPAYRGLWRAVADYQPPDESESLPPLREAAPAPPLRLAMSQLDRAWDAWRDAPPAAREELRVVAIESMRESRRAAPQAMEASFDEAIELLRVSPLQEATIEASCLDCHSRFRDGG